MAIPASPRMVLAGHPQHLYRACIAARIAAEFDKPNGLAGLSPSELPGRLLDPDIEELPSAGKRMCVRLQQAGLTFIEKLRQAEPGWLRSASASVTGAHFWYVLHGYDVEAPQPAFLTTRRGEVHERAVRTRREPGGGKRRAQAYLPNRLLYPSGQETRALWPLCSPWMRKGRTIRNPARPPAHAARSLLSCAAWGGYGAAGRHIAP
ncbi:MAG: hypothetical protein OXL36_22480 [Bryobacterales bacterium]|nr:hypothetical protein [Bryobacterales bacterium]MDE0296172.1 hypothetical protein [Bryobacterales bacterium]